MRRSERANISIDRDREQGTCKDVHRHGACCRAAVQQRINEHGLVPQSPSLQVNYLLADCHFIAYSASIIKIASLAIATGGQVSARDWLHRMTLPESALSN